MSVHWQKPTSLCRCRGDIASGKTDRFVNFPFHHRIIEWSGLKKDHSDH